MAATSQEACWCARECVCACACVCECLHVYKRIHDVIIPSTCVLVTAAVGGGRGDGSNEPAGLLVGLGEEVVGGVSAAKSSCEVKNIT